MADLFYPLSLPGPMAAPFQPAELRELSSLPGPQQLRAMQLDLLASQDVDFCFSHEQVEVFTDWCENDLIKAGSWFSTHWPNPSGDVSIVRFVGEPQLPTFYPNFGWHVSAKLEVRGRGMRPLAPFVPPVAFYLDWQTNGLHSLLGSGQVGTDYGDAWASWTDWSYPIVPDIMDWGTNRDSGDAMIMTSGGGKKMVTELTLRLPDTYTYPDGIGIFASGTDDQVSLTFAEEPFDFPGRMVLKYNTTGGTVNACIGPDYAIADVVGQTMNIRVEHSDSTVEWFVNSVLVQTDTYDFSIAKQAFTSADIDATYVDGTAKVSKVHFVVLDASANFLSGDFFDDFSGPEETGPRMPPITFGGFAWQIGGGGGPDISVAGGFLVPAAGRTDAYVGINTDDSVNTDVFASASAQLETVFKIASPTPDAPGFPIQVLSVDIGNAAAIALYGGEQEIIIAEVTLYTDDEATSEGLPGAGWYLHVDHVALGRDNDPGLGNDILGDASNYFALPDLANDSTHTLTVATVRGESQTYSFDGAQVGQTFNTFAAVLTRKISYFDLSTQYGTMVDSVRCSAILT